MERSEHELCLFRREDVERATEVHFRQYFCGNLRLPQELDFIRTADLEIGISRYDHFAADQPHAHARTPDMVYVLEGEYHIRLPEEGRDLILRAGDFLSIPPKTPYASKARAGTRVLFVKQTPENDKIPYPPDDALRRWLETQPD